MQFFSFNQRQEGAHHFKDQAHSSFFQMLQRFRFLTTFVCVNNSLVPLHLGSRCSERVPLIDHMKRRGAEYCHVMSVSPS